VNLQGRWSKNTGETTTCNQHRTYNMGPTQKNKRRHMLEILAGHMMNRHVVAAASASIFRIYLRLYFLNWPHIVFCALDHILFLGKLGPTINVSGSFPVRLARNLAAQPPLPSWRLALNLSLHSHFLAPTSPHPWPGWDDHMEYII